VPAFGLYVRVDPEPRPLMNGRKQSPLPRVNLKGSVGIQRALLFLVFIASPLSASAELSEHRAPT
jgi:hypothetical protein